MFHAVVAAALQDAQEARDIRIDIGVRIDQRVTDTGLCGEMDHPVWLVLGEQSINGDAILQTGLDESEAGARRQFRKPGLLQCHVIVGIEIVEADDLVAAVQQRLGRVKSDETRNAGDEDFHRGLMHNGAAQLSPLSAIDYPPEKPPKFGRPIQDPSWYGKREAVEMAGGTDAAQCGVLSVNF